MKAKMKAVIGVMKPTTQNQACMWSEPDIIGWLDKRGGKFKSWKKRFFVLQGSYLFYFEDDFKIQAKNPLGVIPLDASKVDTTNEESGDASKRYMFSICLGKQFLGYSKRDTYVVAAPSHQALDEWVLRIKIAAETREGLLDQLRKARWRGGDLRRMLENSMGNREILEYGACTSEGQALMAEFQKVQEGIAKLQEDVAMLESQADHGEGALMMSMVVWDILNQYLTGKFQTGEQSLAQHRIVVEKEAVQNQYKMFQAKGNYLQGQDIEYLGKEAREKLRYRVEHALYVVQERQAKIRSKAPRYSFNSDPKIFEDEGESLQQDFQQDTEGTQPAALRFYQNIQAEVLETAEHLKNLKTAALKIAGIEGRGEGGTDRVASQANERMMASNSNMLTDVMKRKGKVGKEFPVEDTMGNQVVEGTSKAWLHNQNQNQEEQRPGMQNQFASPQSPQNWPQQNQMRAMGPPSESSFGPPQFQSSMGGLSQSRSPFRRPFVQPQQPGMRPSPESFPAMPRQAQFALQIPAFPPPSSEGIMNQKPPPIMPPGSPGQTFQPRGFQQQMSSMPQPPTSTMLTGNFGYSGGNQQSQFPLHGMLPPPPPPPGSGGMMVTRPQAGASFQTSQVPSNFAMQRMQPPSALRPGPQQLMRAPAPNFPVQGMNVQMQQVMRLQQVGMGTPTQVRMQPQMARQNFPRQVQLQSIPQNFPRLPVSGGPQQHFNRPPQTHLAPPNLNTQMGGRMQFGNARLHNAAAPRPS